MKDAEREAIRWFAQAMDDYRFAEWVQTENRFFDKGCFIAQQAGEKALKACLYASGERRVFGHSLFELVSGLIKLSEAFESIVESCKRLDRFYIPTRYPNGLPGGSPFQVYSSKELAVAVDDLGTVIKAASGYLDTQGIRTRQA